MSSPTINSVFNNFDSIEPEKYSLLFFNKVYFTLFNFKACITDIHIREYW